MFMLYSTFGTEKVGKSFLKKRGNPAACKFSIFFRGSSMQNFFCFSISFISGASHTGLIKSDLCTSFWNSNPKSFDKNSDCYKLLEHIAHKLFAYVCFIFLNFLSLVF